MVLRKPIQRKVSYWGRWRADRKYPAGWFKAKMMECFVYDVKGMRYT